MPPAKKKVQKLPTPPSSSEEDEEDYGSESEPVNSQSDDNLEVNREHLLNYESDSSDDMENSQQQQDDSLDLGKGLSKQKEELTMSNPWGQQKKGFYGRDKKRDDESSSDGADEDEYQEAIRLQKVRAHKLQLLNQQQKKETAKEEEEEEDVSQESSSSSDESVAHRRSRGKLGDRLFADTNKQEIQKEYNLKAMLKQVKNKTVQVKLLEQQAPEMKGLLQDFEDSLRTITTQLQPLLQMLPQIKQKNKQLGTFIELKYNLLLSYCTYLSFYLLLRLDSSESVTDHQVLFKIVTLRKTLEGLQGLDAKLESILAKKTSAKKIPKDSVEVSEASSEDQDQDESNIDDYEIDNEEGEDDMSEEEEEEQDEDEEMEDEDEFSNVGEVEQLLTRAEEREIRMRQAEELGDRLKKINKDDIKSIVKSSKAPTKKERSLQKEREEGEQKRKEQEEQDKQKWEQRKKRREEEEEQEKNIEKAREAKRLSKIEKKEKAKEAREVLEESLKHQNEAIARNVNYTIMKSKGLTRKRKKIDRNPRVKHREKYRKALAKRKSRVQEFKEGPQGKYGGESSGFRAGIIRSTALN